MSIRREDVLKRARAVFDFATEPGPPHDHVVQFYDTNATLIQSASAYLAGGLLRACPAIVIAESQQRPLFERQLAGMGVSVADAVDMRQLIFLDSRETLDRFMVEGAPDERLFRQVVGTVVASATEVWHPARLQAYGDMVDLLWADGNPDAALALEELWNDLAQRHAFGLFCGYSADHFERDDQRAGFDAVCRQHGRIMPIDVTLPVTSESPVPAS